MVHYRQLLPGVVAAMLFSFGVTSAYAQGSPAFTCNATGGNPRIVRSEGVVELAGDLVLNCTGGMVTPAGTPVPLSHVQVSLNTNVTSRLTGTGTGNPDSEAILSIDEPFPSGDGAFVPTSSTPVSGAATHQQGCLANGAVDCEIVSVGTASNFGAGGNYNGVTGLLGPGPHYNLFQGTVNPAVPNQINWLGVPIDGPGTSGVRIIRITNVRVNASQLSPGGSLVPTEVSELIGISGSQSIIINNPQQVVALALQGLYGTVNSPSGVSPAYQQCESLNTSLLGMQGGVTASPIALTATEGFAAAFKSVSYTSGGRTYFNQNVLASFSTTESGFVPGNLPGSLDQSGRTIGLADTSTEITFTLTGIGTGVSLFVPNSVPLLGPGGVPTYGIDGVTPTYANLVGAGGAIVNSGDSNPPDASGTTRVTVTGTTASITYVVIVDDPNVVESITVPLSVAFTNGGSAIPPPGVTSVAINFTPLSSSAQNVSSASAPVPRFSEPYGPVTAFAINACTSTTPLSGRVASESGPQNARIWSIEVDSGGGPAYGAAIDGFAIRQTFGAACSPVVTSPQFPVSLGDIPANSSATAPITIDFTGCAANARFSVNIPLSANGGNSTGSIVRNNEFR
jgi:hypothetical protein